MAILVVALAATLAIYLLWQQSIALRQIQNLDARAQVREIARAGTTWAAAIISQDDRTTDNLGEPWAQPLPPIEVEQATLEGNIVDEQSKFNLNSVYQPGAGAAAAADPGQSGTQSGMGAQSGMAGSGSSAAAGGGTGAQANLPADAFRKLLSRLNIDPSLCDALIDWIDPDSIVTEPGGAEDTYYLSQEPPYRAGNNYLASIGELRLIKGFTPEIVDRLSPYVTALPSTATKININTATPDMLTNFMYDVNAETIVASRNRAPFTKVDDFHKLVNDQAWTRLNPLIDIKSDFFSANARVTQGRTSITYHAILQRSATGWPQILSISEEPM